MTHPGAPERENDEACPLCGHGRSRIVTSGEDYEYATLPGPWVFVECSRCEHYFLDPRPREDELAAIYPETYYTVNRESPLFLRGFIYQTKMKRDVARMLALVRGVEIRSVVDLGCGDGERLARLGESLPKPVELLGVDLQPTEARRVELERRGVRLEEGNIESGGLDRLRDAGHDVIIMSQIIEHLRDPCGCLRSVREKLAPGGRLILETPHRGGLDFRLFREKWWGGYHIPRHFHLFTDASIADAVRGAGLDVVEQGFMPSPGFWITSLRNRLGLVSTHGSSRFGEFLNYSNLPSVAFFTAFDLLAIRLGFATSTQFLVAEAVG